MTTETADTSTEQTATETTTTATEVKDAPDAQTPTEAEAAEPAAVDAPVVYDFKAPEGMELDAAAVAKFKDLATELKLPADSAQKVVDLQVALKQAEAEAFAAQVEKWGEETKADKEIGGAKFDENLGLAKKGLEQFATPELRSLLDSTGMGNHPEVVRMLMKVGKAISEDSLVRGGQSEQGTKSTAEVLYGNP